MIETKYYVYEWYIKETKEIFYVGKGSKNRVTSMKDRNSYFKNIREKYDCEYRILNYFEDEQEAYDFELKRGLELKQIGQAKACYVLGNFKRYICDEVKEKMKPTQFKKGDKNKPWNYGMKMNKEFKEKLRNINLGKKQSEETKIKRSNSLKNHLVSENTRNKISEARKKQISIYNIKTKEFKIYNSISELAIILNISQSSLCRPLKTSNIYKNKYIVKYVNTEVSN